MSRRDPTVPLRHMRDHARLALELSEQRERDDLDHDVTFRLALIRCLEVLGEAANRIPPDIQKRYPEIPWRGVIGLRNVLIHAYDDVDLDVVWRIVSVELELLLHEVERMIRAEEAQQ